MEEEERVNKQRVLGAGLTAAQGLALALAALAGGVVLFVLSVVSIALIPIGIGAFTTPLVLSAVRSHANVRRRFAAQWGGLRVPESYRPFPSDMRNGIVGIMERCSLLVKDPATWRDLRWLVLDMTLGFLTAVLPAALTVYGLHGVLLLCGLWQPLADGNGENWYTFIAVDGWGTAALAALVGAGLLAVCSGLNPRLLHVHFLLSRYLLAPPREVALNERIDQLTESRHEALDVSAAELRRIERDLHDGAQARLVAMGMSFATIEALVDKDPQHAKVLLAHARETSAEALTELRDLVRGIHPPVLAERGLGDAVRALALRMPMTVKVDIDVPGRLDEPVESAAYFAASEALTNAAKHSQAQQVTVGIQHRDGMLRIGVGDDGQGGASVGRGSGLTGIERRLSAFDGKLTVTSPPGGPTMVTMEIPCRLIPDMPTV
ncbi:sensor histidine kinase [Streptomyces sp. CA-132043]|uniref:sensor histidine kinase n=1 Tax=Streptomyces sp. CA-132043 TaxID=3240048 RepID=UPI003D93ADF3